MLLIIGSLALAPRLVSVLWWAIAPRRWEDTFSFAALVVAGIVFMPWTTLAIVIIWPAGSDVSEWLLLALAVVGDLATHGSSRLLLRPLMPRRLARDRP